jgi:hypothetical protein
MTVHVALWPFTLEYDEATAIINNVPRGGDYLASVSPSILA